MKSTSYRILVTSFLLLAIIGTGRSQIVISGVVTDQRREPLVGATIIIEGKTIGTESDDYGRFELPTENSFPLTLICSYVGYNPVSVLVERPDSDVNIMLEESVLFFDDVVISASRRWEKMHEAPAAVSVITARKMEASPNENPLRNLINEPGVIVQQQSAGRINVHLRGDEGLVFGSASYPMLDYMPLALPGDLYLNLASPVNNVDLDRIEVVRGPGSALYGPGVTAGVIHFISKSAIDKPGTSIELLGGELSTYGLSVRHATRLSDKFGFKLNAFYKIGDEFSLDPNDPQDAKQIAKLQNTVSIPAVNGEVLDPSLPPRQLLGPEDLDPDGDGNPMQNFWRSSLLSGTMEFRPQEDLSLFLYGGMNTLSSVFYNAFGEGVTQGTLYWVQARIQKGGLFGQLAFRDSNAGTEDNPSWLYQTGSVASPATKWLEGQLQYNFDTPQFLQGEWTAGFDHRLILSDTKNLLHGRFENGDDYGITGGYLQTKLALSPRIDFVLAGRLDRFSFLDETSFSPRAVMVYKPRPNHTVRAGFNRATGAPTPTEINADFPLATLIPGAFDIWYIGNRNRQTFGDDPQMIFNGVLPFPSLPVGTPGFPLAYAQGAVTGGILPVLQESLVSDPLLAPLIPSIIEYLGNPANFVNGTAGTFAGINLFNGLPLGILDAPSASLRIEDTWEIGYKGLFGDKLGVSIDLYNRRIDGAVLFTAISPGYTLLNADELPTALGNGVKDNFEPFLTGLLSPLVGGSIPDESTLQATVDQLSEIVGGAYTQAGSEFLASIQSLIEGAILAATPTVQVPDNGVTHVAAGFRTFEPYRFWGADLGLNYYVGDDLTVFGNYSWISENQFNPKIVDVDGSESITILQPDHRFRLGLNYTPTIGVRANLSYQYDPSFKVLLGQYSGDTDVKSLIDAGVGYKFENGLIVDISAQNLFNNEYRTYPNFPKIGRRVLLRMTYSFGGK